MFPSRRCNPESGSSKGTEENRRGGSRVMRCIEDYFWGGGGEITYGTLDRVFMNTTPLFVFVQEFFFHKLKLLFLSSDCLHLSVV